MISDRYSTGIPWPSISSDKVLAIRLSESCLASAILSDSLAVAINMRGVIVHEVVHALGNVRIAFPTQSSQTKCIVRSEGLNFRINGKIGSNALEEYVASRVQSKFLLEHGHYEVTTTAQALLEPTRNQELQAAVLKSVLPLSPDIEVEAPGNGKIQIGLPSVDDWKLGHT